MRRVSWAFLALAVLSTSALALTSRSATWSGKIAGTEGARGTGVASMKPTADGAGTDVKVMLNGDAAATTRPWHVHIGSRAKGGGVLGGGSSYAPIVTDGSAHGMSRATLSIAPRVLIGTALGVWSGWCASRATWRSSAASSG